MRIEAVKQYSMTELETLLDKDNSLIDTAVNMIETASDYYENETIDDCFIKNYLLTEVNNGFIRIKA